MSIAAKSCSVEGCNSRGKKLKNGNVHFVRGFCMRHYEKHRLYGDPLHGRTHTFGEGRSKNPLYKTYRGIKKRCFDIKDHNYLKYGAKGVTMWSEWIDTATGFSKFEKFIQDELGEKPSSKHSIDRIDNSRGYEPGNLRWATDQVQAINRRTPVNNVSGQKGVYFANAENRWCAVISINGQKKRLGRFKHKSEAIEARLKAEQLYYAPLLDKNL